MLHESPTPSFEAWKTFIADGIILENKVRPIIARSWQRCRAAGLDVWIDSPKPNYSDLNSKRAENQDLLSAASPFMQLALALLNANISISDPSGYVFELVTPLKYYPRSLASYHSESRTGTSCITLALAEMVPVRVDTYEHYAMGAHNYSGASSPILDSSSKPLGFIHAVNPFELLPFDALSLVTSAARLVELKIRTSIRSLQEETIREPLQAMLNACPYNVIILNQEGKIITFNAIFKNIMGLKENNLVDHSLTALLSEPGDLSSLIGPALHFNDNSILKVKCTAINNHQGVLDYHLLRKKQINFFNDENYTVLILKQNSTGQEMRKTYPSAAPAKKDTISAFESCSCIGTSPAWEEMKDTIRKISPFPTNVLLQGESGSGKEVVARVIHNLSNRKGRFVEINCGAIPRELLYSELFGYEEGAFTGARKGGAIGKFEYADTGTLFLDEIGEMPQEMQISLLRAIQERTITRFGSNESREVDVRIIAATNKDMQELVHKGIFREDLYYRLSVVDIQLPPLKERKEDITLLAEHFISELSKQYKVKPKNISSEALKVLYKYNWPGNVRELKNVIEKALITSSGDYITLEVLPSHILYYDTDSWLEDNSAHDLNAHERTLIIEVLERHHGNIAQSARELNISRGTLYRKLDKYHIELNIRAVSKDK